ncbi:MAG: carboxypeptidase-like regulatory domain-containing protein, partial [Prevotella sp.]|nr:carboxypeptidase-like regulatory domain-containing protein [Prevotella sp.]
MNGRLRYIILSLLCIVAIGASAQITAVHGTVTDEFGELTGASVCEIDGNGRIIEATVTDINGNFSMKISNPKDKLRFSYVGFKNVIVPIDREEY